MTGASRRDARSRRRAEAAGRRVETLAAIFLVLKGYQILARRYQAPSGEIDIIAKRGPLLAFVEVKARAQIETAIDAVQARARRRIERAAEMYMAQRPALAGCDMRYDIIAVARWRFRHLRGAWRCGDQRCRRSGGLSPRQTPAKPSFVSPQNSF